MCSNAETTGINIVKKFPWPGDLLNGQKETSKQIENTTHCGVHGLSSASRRQEDGKPLSHVNHHQAEKEFTGSSPRNGASLVTKITKF